MIFSVCCLVHRIYEELLWYCASAVYLENLQIINISVLLLMELGQSGSWQILDFSKSNCDIGIECFYWITRKVYFMWITDYAVMIVSHWLRNKCCFQIKISRSLFWILIIYSSFHPVMLRAQRYSIIKNQFQPLGCTVTSWIRVGADEAYEKLN